MRSVIGMIPTFPFDGLPNLNLIDPTTSDMGLNLIEQLCQDSNEEAIHHPLLHESTFKPPFLPFQSIPYNTCQKKSAAVHGPTDPLMSLYGPSSVVMDKSSHYPNLKDMLQSVPTGYGYQCGLNSLIDFGKDLGGCGAADARGGNIAEKQRRGQMSEKFNELRSLIPNPTKKDRASIIADAAEYIKELLRTVEELKTLVQRNRCTKHNRKKSKMGDGISVGVYCSHPFKAQLSGDCKLGPLRSSWLQRKSKETTVDVRIVEDEAYIKIMQRKKANSLLIVADILNELQLALLHLAFGNVADYYNFMINTKIPESSVLHASSIAEKFIGAMNAQFQVMPFGY